MDANARECEVNTLIAYGSRPFAFLRGFRLKNHAARTFAERSGRPTAAVRPLRPASPTGARRPRGWRRLGPSGLFGNPIFIDSKIADPTLDDTDGHRQENSRNPRSGISPVVSCETCERRTVPKGTKLAARSERRRKRHSLLLRFLSFFSANPDLPLTIVIRTHAERPR